MSTTDDLDARVVELETRLAHHERMAEDLSAVLAEQDRAITQLIRQVRRLTERLGAVESGWDRSPQDDQPPPHY